MPAAVAPAAAEAAAEQAQLCNDSIISRRECGPLCSKGNVSWVCNGRGSCALAGIWQSLGGDIYVVYNSNSRGRDDRPP